MKPPSRDLTVLLWFTSNTCAVPAIWDWQTVKGTCYLTVEPLDEADLAFFSDYFKERGVAVLMDARPKDPAKKPKLFILRQAAITFATQEDALIQDIKKRGAESFISIRINHLFFELWVLKTMGFLVINSCLIAARRIRFISNPYCAYP